MSIPRLLLNWKDWAKAIHKMEDLILTHVAIAGEVIDDCVIYSPPRGGLVLGVTMSHTLGIPLILDPYQANGKRVIFLDDIVDSGAEATRFLSIRPNALIFAWVLKHNQHTNQAKSQTNALLFATTEWVVFPWEKLEYAESDKEHYEASRK